MKVRDVFACGIELYSIASAEPEVPYELAVVRMCVKGISECLYVFLALEKDIPVEKWCPNPLPLFAHQEDAWFARVTAHVLQSAN